jgi:hypothetical protein
VGGAFVWGDQPGAASYTPSPSYQRNYSNLTNTITRTGVGTYSVNMPGVGAAGGSVVATAYGTGSERCKVAGWWMNGMTQQASVRCFNASGAPADTRFTARYLRGVSRDSQPYRLYTSTVERGLESGIWDGQLLVPDLARFSELVETRDTDGNPSWWYRNDDGSFSKGLVNRAGKLVGMYTVARDRITIGLDADGDSVLDVLRESALDRNLLLVDEMRGIAVANDMLAAVNPLCRENMGTTVGLIPSGPSADTRATIGCPAVGGSGGGTAAGGSSAAGSSTQNPLAPLCDEVLSRPRPCDRLTQDGFGQALLQFLGEKALEKVIVFAAGARAPAIGAFLAVLLPPSETHATGCESSNRCHEEYVNLQLRELEAERARVSEFCSGENVCEGPEAPAAQDETDDGEEGDDEDSEAEPIMSSPNGGHTSAGGCAGPVAATSDPDEPANAQAVLYDLCRQQQHSLWSSSVENLEMAAVESDCLAPVVNPSPASASDPNAETRHIRCTDTRDGSYVTNVDELLGRAGLGGSCGINESPGVDGTCTGFNTSMGSTGGVNAWVSLGEVLGVNACDPRVCTP